MSYIVEHEGIVTGGSFILGALSTGDLSLVKEVVQSSALDSFLSALHPDLWKRDEIPGYPRSEMDRYNMYSSCLFSTPNRVKLTREK